MSKKESLFAQAFQKNAQSSEITSENTFFPKTFSIEKISQNDQSKNIQNRPKIIQNSQKDQFNKEMSEISFQNTLFLQNLDEKKYHSFKKNSSLNYENYQKDVIQKSAVNIDDNLNDFNQNLLKLDLKRFDQFSEQDLKIWTNLYFNDEGQNVSDKLLNFDKIFDFIRSNLFTQRLIGLKLINKIAKTYFNNEFLLFSEFKILGEEKPLKMNKFEFLSIFVETNKLFYFLNEIVVKNEFSIEYFNELLIFFEFYFKSFTFMDIFFASKNFSLYSKIKSTIYQTDDFKKRLENLFPFDFTLFINKCNTFFKLENPFENFKSNFKNFLFFYSYFVNNNSDFFETIIGSSFTDNLINNHHFESYIIQFKTNLTQKTNAFDFIIESKKSFHIQRTNYSFDASILVLFFNNEYKHLWLDAFIFLKTAFLMYIQLLSKIEKAKIKYFFNIFSILEQYLTPQIDLGIIDERYCFQILNAISSKKTALVVLEPFSTNKMSKLIKDRFDKNESVFYLSKKFNDCQISDFASIEIDQIVNNSDFLLCFLRIIAYLSKITDSDSLFVPEFGLLMDKLSDRIFCNEVLANEVKSALNIPIYETAIQKLIENYFYFSFFKPEFTKIMFIFFMDGFYETYFLRILEDLPLVHKNLTSLNFNFEEKLFLKTKPISENYKKGLLKFHMKFRDANILNDCFLGKFLKMNDN